MEKITTGIDRLERLLQKRGKISLNEACSELGIAMDVIEDWAELLEKEHVVTLTYNLSHKYIELKEATEHDVVVSAKRVGAEKDAFTRKIESAINNLHHDTVGFTRLKKEYESIQKTIKDEVHEIKSQLMDLEQFDKLKSRLAKDIEKQKVEYDKFTRKYEQEIEAFDNKYKKIIDKLKSEHKIIVEAKKHVDSLKGEKDKIEKIISSATTRLETVSKTIEKRLDIVTVAEKKITVLQKELIELENGVSEKKEKALANLAKKMGSTREEITDAHNALLVSAKEKVKAIQTYTVMGHNVYEAFSGKFLKKIKTLDLFDEIESERSKLFRDLELLKKKVIAFRVTAKNSTLNKEFGDIEKIITDYEKRRNTLVGKIRFLLAHMK